MTDSSDEFHSLAAKYERAKLNLSIFEDQITDEIIACGLTLDKWSDWHYDWYDGSLTITGCSDITPEQIEKLKTHGFYNIRIEA